MSAEREGRPSGDPLGGSEPPVPDLPDELFPPPVRPAIFRLLWALALALLVGLGVVAWRYLTIVGS